MTTLLELKEKLTRFYGKYDIYITPVIKFTVALTAFLLINHNIGYMEKISSTPIALILALICSILPVGGTVFIGSVLILLDMYALSLEVCIVALILFILMYILYFRFSPKNEYGVLLTPICFGLNIPFVMPVGMGLLRELYSMFSLVCGIVLYFFLNGVKQNETTLGGVDEKDAATSKIVVALNQLLGNREMYLVLAIMVVTLVIVYIIRKMSIEHAWAVAIIFGILFEAVGMIAGDMVLGISGKTITILVGSIISCVIAFVIQFLFFNLDYSRTERLQFEDDEYYYYVKAVPKMTVAAPTNTVKKINTQRRPANQTAHPAGQGRPSGQSRSGGQNIRSAEGSARSVVTERTAPARSSAPYGQQNPYRGREMTGGRSVTISSDHMAQDDSDDYEELF